MTADPDSSGFVPISPNPFIVGNPVRDTRMFYGREVEFELVRKRFTEAEAKGGLLVFSGERRSGKTSILFQILNGRLGPEFIPVLIDMQSMAIKNEQDFLQRISQEIAQHIAPEGNGIASPDFSSAAMPAPLFHRFVADLLGKNPNKRLILLFDEYELLESKIDSGILTEDTLYILSSLMESHSVFLVFTGSLGLEKRRKDYWRILGKSLFRRVSYLERSDAIRLITEPLKGEVEYEPGVVGSIYRLTAGQPFYTQAVCQSLVDHLNDHRTRTVASEAVESVVEATVRNPFPQMIFLWESLEPDEKLSLALLAETLADETAHANVGSLQKTLTQGRYPLDLDPGRLATALENLFKREILLKDQATPPGYAFQMDLWRHWVRRMHSVWQVMRELGMETRVKRGRRRYVVGGLAAAVVAALAIVAVLRFTDRGGPGPLPEDVEPVEMAFLNIEVEPTNATISRNGEILGRGMVRAPVLAGVGGFRISAPGYADSTFTRELSGDDSLQAVIRLRALRGGVRVVSNPPGAKVFVDGEEVGVSPLTVPGLAVASEHVVEARVEGFEPVRGTFRVEADTTLELPVLALSRRTVQYTVTTTPAHARIQIDDETRGETPLTESLAVGSHRILASLEGYLSSDTTVFVDEGMPPLHLRLRLMPPGFLQVMGDSVAVIYVNEQKIKEHTYNSGWIELTPGTHSVRVRMLSGTLVTTSVDVKSAERLIYNYTSNTISAAGGS